MNNTLPDYAALVTGANSGLGLECTRELHRRGVPVVMVARRRALLEEKAAEIKSSHASGPELYTVPADIANAGDVEGLVQFVQDRGIQVKWLLNCAGAGRYGEFGTYSSDDIQEVLKANLVGLIMISQALLPQVMAHRGTICNIISTAAQNTRPHETVYTAAKWGARGFTETLRAELKGKPVRVMAVYPGGMNTPFWDSSKDYVPDPTKFMSAQAVADRIISNILDAQNCQVSDITINRP